MLRLFLKTKAGFEVKEPGMEVMASCVKIYRRTWILWTLFHSCAWSRMDLLGMRAKFPSIYDDPQLLGSDLSDVRLMHRMTQKKLTGRLLPGTRCLSPLLLMVAPPCSG